MEIVNVSGISCVKLLIELTFVVSIDKQTQGTFKCMRRGELLGLQWKDIDWTKYLSYVHRFDGPEIDFRMNGWLENGLQIDLSGGVIP